MDKVIILGNLLKKYMMENGLGELDKDMVFGRVI